MRVPQRYLVTGAQGFIGRHLVACVLEQQPSAEVVGLGRSSAQQMTFSAGGRLPDSLVQRLSRHQARYRYQRVDLTDVAGLATCLKEFQPDCVVHLASALHSAAESELLRTNVEGTLALLKVLSCRPALLILGSSAAVYGEPSLLPMKESHPCLPTAVYGVSKLAVEHFVRVKAPGLPFVTARIFNVVGPGQSDAHVAGRFAAQLTSLRGTAQTVLETGPLSPSRDFVDVRDVAQALWWLAQNGHPGEAYNVGRGEEKTVRDLLAALIQASGLRVEVREAARHPAGVSRNVADIAKLRALGFTPRFSLGQSMADLWAAS